MKQVYLDYNSSTPLDPRVLEEMLPYLQNNYGNASSIHGVGQRARAGLEQSRERLAVSLNCRPDELYFTSGATEANNLAIKGVADALAHKGKHIITTRVEHQAVLEPCEYLKRQGYDVSYLEVDSGGRVSIDELRSALREDTILVSIIYVNNETGTIQDIKELAAVAHEHKVLFHTDAVQAIGRMPVDIRDLDVDLLSVSAHKFYGPKGVGALFARVGTRFTPVIHGGSHERGKRAGTENIAAAVGMARALELAVAEMDERRSHVERLIDRLNTGILERVPSARFHGDREHWLKYTMFFTFPGSDGEAILVNLDMKGIAVSSGSACTSGATEPSHVLLAMGVPSEEADTAVRFSLGKDTTDADIDYVLETLPPIIENLRQMSPEYAKAE